MAAEPSTERRAPNRSPGRRTGRSRWVGAVLIGIAIVLLLPLAQHLPTERQIRLDVSHPASLRQLDLTWLDGDERLRSTVLRFGDRSAPPQIHTQVRVTDGTYRLQMTIQRTDGITETERRVSFEPDVSLVVIPVP